MKGLLKSAGENNWLISSNWKTHVVVVDVNCPYKLLPSEKFPWFFGEGKRKQRNCTINSTNLSYILTPYASKDFIFHWDTRLISPCYFLVGCKSSRDEADRFTRYFAVKTSLKAYLRFKITTEHLELQKIDYKIYW